MRTIVRCFLREALLFHSWLCGSAPACAMRSLYHAKPHYVDGRKPGPATMVSSASPKPVAIRKRYLYRIAAAGLRSTVA
jgi:hypothetical protein